MLAVLGDILPSKYLEAQEVKGDNPMQSKVNKQIVTSLCQAKYEHLYMYNVQRTKISVA